MCVLVEEADESFAGPEQKPVHVDDSREPAGSALGDLRRDDAAHAVTDENDSPGKSIDHAGDAGRIAVEIGIPGGDGSSPLPGRLGAMT
jgi:hypothetical protein